MIRIMLISSRKQESSIFIHLIDDAVARVIRSEGGYIWACKNYDGDVMSDMVATAFGSLSMMTSVLAITYTDIMNMKLLMEQYRDIITSTLKGEETSTNPIATIFAWTGALKKERRTRLIFQSLSKFADTA